MEQWTGNEKIFRTYLKGGGKDGKRCVDRHKGISQVRTWDNASEFDNFGGVLQDGFVDISFDDKEMSDAFLDMAEQMQWKCLCLLNPANGHLHTYWKDTKRRIQKFNKDLTLAVGFVADIHGGETYIPLRVNGVDRFPPEYDILPGEDYQEVPDELIPVQTNIRLWKSREGDGRNSDLYGYILVLQSQMQLSDDRIRAMYRDCINPFILAEKLSDNELDVILRDESFKDCIVPSFFNGNSFKFDEFAKVMRDQFHVVKIHEQLHIYKDGVYVPGRKPIEAKMLELIPKLRKTQRKEVIEYLDLIADEVQVMKPEFVAFRNGIINVKTGSITGFSPDLVITNQIPWNYAPNNYDELMDKTLNKLSCDDHDIRTLLLEMAGYCMYRSNNLQKAFVLVGGGSNGKSVFLDVMKKLVGYSNLASLDIGEIGDRFNTVMIFGKLANIGDDISDDFLHGKQTALFKKLVTGNRIKGEYKGQDAFDFDPYCKLIFSTNDMPRIKDRTGAVQRRLIMIPFKAKFSTTDKDYNQNITEDLCKQESIEYLISISIQAFQKVIERKSFTMPQSVKDELREYELLNNPVLGFLNETDEKDIVNQLKKDVYRRYQVYCQESMIQPLSEQQFGKTMKNECGYYDGQVRLNDKVVRIWKKGNGKNGKR